VKVAGQVADVPDQSRLGKLVGMLGAAGGEGANALAALDKGLTAAGLSWGWLAQLVEHGEAPGGERDKIFRRLVAEQLRGSLVRAWAMAGGDAHFVRLVLEECEGGSAAVDVGRVSRALEIASDVRRQGR
jgi:hypothetical protein